MTLASDREEHGTSHVAGSHHPQKLPGCMFENPCLTEPCSMHIILAGMTPFTSSFAGDVCPMIGPLCWTGSGLCCQASAAEDLSYQPLPSVMVAETANLRDQFGTGRRFCKASLSQPRSAVSDHSLSLHPGKCREDLPPDTVNADITPYMCPFQCYPMGQPSSLMRLN